MNLPVVKIWDDWPFVSDDLAAIIGLVFLFFSQFSKNLAEITPSKADLNVIQVGLTDALRALPLSSFIVDFHGYRAGKFSQWFQINRLQACHHQDELIKCVVRLSAEGGCVLCSVALIMNLPPGVLL